MYAAHKNFCRIIVSSIRFYFLRCKGSSSLCWEMQKQKELTFHRISNSEIPHTSQNVVFPLKVHNAVSPHTEIGLDPDSQYSVSVRSVSRKGESLPSTAILFHTKSDSRGVCSIGEPLLISGESAILHTLL